MVMSSPNIFNDRSFVLFCFTAHLLTSNGTYVYVHVCLLRSLEVQREFFLNFMLLLLPKTIETSIFWKIRMTTLYLSNVIWFQCSHLHFCFMMGLIASQVKSWCCTSKDFPVVWIEESGRKIESLHWAWCIDWLNSRETALVDSLLS